MSSPESQKSLLFPSPSIQAGGAPIEHQKWTKNWAKHRVENRLDNRLEKIEQASEESGHNIKIEQDYGS